MSHFLALSLFDASLQAVTGAALQALEHLNYVASPVPFPPVPPQRHCDEEPQATLWTPAACPGSCAFMSHSSDGWHSLTSILATRLKVRTLKIRASAPAGPGYVCDFNLWSHGHERRKVMALNDEPWVFFQSGPAVPQEDLNMYKARRISDRVTASYLAELAQRLGWPIAEPAFWNTNEQSVVLHSKALGSTDETSAA